MSHIANLRWLASLLVRHTLTLPTVSRAGVLLRLAVVCGLAGIAAAQDPIADALADVESRKAAIAAHPDLDPDAATRALGLLDTAKSDLEAARKLDEKAAAFHASIETAPIQAAEFRRQANDRDSGDATVPPPGATAEELQGLITKQRAVLASKTNDLEDTQRELSDLAEREAAVTKLQTAARAHLAELEQSLASKPPDAEPTIVSESRRIALEADQRKTQSQLEMLVQEVLSLPPRTDLAQARRDLDTAEIARLESLLQRLTDAASAQRASAAEAVQRDTERAQAEAANQHPLVQHQAETNATLGRELTELAAMQAAVGPELRAKRGQGAALEDIYTLTKTQLDRAGAQSLGVAILREQRQRLADVTKDRERVASKWGNELLRAEARRFQLTMNQRDLSNTGVAVEKVLSTSLRAPLPQEQRGRVAQQLRTLLETRRELVDKLLTSYSAYLADLRALDDEGNKVAEVTAKFSRLLDEWLLWLPSTTPPGKGTLTDLAAACSWLVDPANWSAVAAVVTADGSARPWLYAALIAVVLVLLLARPRLRRDLSRTNESARSVADDHIGLTLRALLDLALLSAPVPMLLACIGWRLVARGASQATDFPTALGSGLLGASWPLLMVLVLLRLCQPKGIGVVHLRWPVNGMTLVRRQVAWFSWVLITAALLVGITGNQAQPAISDSLGRIVFVVFSIAAAAMSAAIAKPGGDLLAPSLSRAPTGWLHRFRWLWYPLAVGTPIVLAILAIAGYYFTALELDLKVGASIWLVLGVVVGTSLARRWLLIEQRRLAVQQFRERQASATTPDAGTNLDEATVALATINDQSKKLLRTITGVTLLLGLWGIWAAVLPALGVLGQVELWATTALDSTGKEIPRTITLEHLAIAFIAIIVTTTAAKNLPGVLEIIVLKNLPIDAGSRYAIATVARYALVAVGIVFICNTIGVAWGKAQWLVAAMGVGLGFGLQEIIANFVSGLILLFERPIRVGDIVKVGEVQGTVTRIRIRATTITDWDRMELIIPNKDLITGRVQNWTLSNTINRLVVHVGVAYGTDTGFARRELLRVAHEHPAVLDDPSPIATFEQFGDSTLNLVLRCYLGDFENRLGVTDELHRAVQRAFADAGIEIAFPQLDLHVRSETPAAN